MIRQQPFAGNEPRWLNPDTAAAYIGVRVERLRPMVKAGKLPPPSYHLGPNQPRYDRLCTAVLRASAMCAIESGPGGATNANPALTDNREGRSIVAHSNIRTALLAATAQAKL